MSVVMNHLRRAVALRLMKFANLVDPAKISAQLDEMNQNLARVERAAAVEREGTRDELLRCVLQTRLLSSRRQWQQAPAVAPPPMTPRDFAEDLQRLGRLHPHLFERWKQINFVANPIEFAERPAGSCSVGLGRVDGLFAGFIAPYLSGRVLDLGCGPQAVPSYLSGYPTALISGVDPLEPFDAHPFQFHRGFGEFLPWDDGTFDAVINATSLDHAFSLDLVTSEIVRVLRPGGLFLVWEGFVKNSPPYRPSDPDLQPVDPFHLFHFDERWFEEHFSPAFEIVEKLPLDDSAWNPQYSSNYFYALRLRTQR
jgi:SAM-dependent methyltransferase